VLGIECALRVTGYLAVQRLQDGACSDAPEIQLAIARRGVAQVRADGNDQRECASEVERRIFKCFQHLFGMIPDACSLSAEPKLPSVPRNFE